jgi:hypothetical protein
LRSPLVSGVIYLINHSPNEDGQNGKKETISIKNIALSIPVELDDDDLIHLKM